MKNAGAQGMTEYRLAVLPGRELEEKIAAERLELDAAIGASTVQEYSKHFIEVLQFMAREEMEDTLVRWMQKILSQEQSFSVSLNNYSAFPSHTIYMRVQENAGINQLIQKFGFLKDHVITTGGGKLSVHKVYLALAQKLPLNVYEKMVPVYSRKTFHESFLVQELILLKRKDAFEKFKPVQVFGLLPSTALFQKTASSNFTQHNTAKRN